MKNLNIKKILKDIVVFLIMLFIVTNIISFLRKPDLPNQQLPSFHAKTLKDNEIYTSLERKPILLHFWATWCPTCKMEAGNIQRISSSFRVISVAVNSGSDEEIKTYMKKHDLNFETINDSEGKLASMFKVNAFPTTFIFDSDKNLKFAEVGYTSTLSLYIKMWLSR